MYKRILRFRSNKIKRTPGSDLSTRVNTAILFGIVVIGGILLSPLTFVLFLFALGMLSFSEYLFLLSFSKKLHENVIVIFIYTIFLSSIMGIMLFTPYDVIPYFIIPFLIVSSLLLIFLYKRKPLSISKIKYLIIGGFYLLIPIGSFLYLSEIKLNMDFEAVEFFRWQALSAILLIWSNDTFAYLFGRKVGKTPLFPSVSPKKTWEGTISGIICTMILSFTISYFSEKDYFLWMGLAIIFGVFGSLGDLVESKFKRILGVKDSGNILPGHGGILDRFDALYLSMPFAAFYYWIYQYFS